MEHITMEKVTRLRLGPVAVLLLVALLIILVAKRRNLTTDEAVDDSMRTVVNVKNTLVRRDDAAFAVISVVALCAFALWTALRANRGSDDQTPTGAASSGETNSAPAPLPTNPAPDQHHNPDLTA
jgi:hypothetical protein